MRFHIVTIFPGMFDSYLKESLFKRAQAKKIISVRAYDLRAFTKDKHRKVDDRPFGGGPGMVLAVQPVWDAVKKIKNAARKKLKKSKTRVILFSTRGKHLDAAVARRLAKYDDIILVCGRYEGVDERVAEHIADEEISDRGLCVIRRRDSGACAHGNGKPSGFRLSRKRRITRGDQWFISDVHAAGEFCSYKRKKVERAAGTPFRRSQKDR